MPNASSLPRALIACLVLAAAPAARAQGFATTNVQLLQGYRFNDQKFGYDIRNDAAPADGGTLTTLTLNHFSTWEYGDNFAFFDLLTGDFADGNPPNGIAPGATLYAEWHPRLFVNALLGTKGNFLGIFRNWGPAAEVNFGRGFYAYLVGVGLDLALPQPYTVGVNLYYRYDRFDYHEWQASPYWTIPFRVGPVPLLLAGFVDFAGTKDIAGKQGLDIVFQPQLLVDVLGAFGGKPNRLYVGTEWYVHRYPEGAFWPARTVSAPQIMAQWTLH